MELSIESKTENVLLSRKEITGTLVFDKQTPAKKEVISAIAKNLGVDVSLVVVKKIYSYFGSHQAQFVAHVYLSRDVLENIEPEHDYVLEKAEKQAPAAEAK